MVGRDESGKFKKGEYRGGPGRPKAEREAAYMRILSQAVKPEDWIEIVDRAVLDAKRGDATARKWLADYLIGPPVQKNENENSGAMIIRIIDGDAVE